MDDSEINIAEAEKAPLIQNEQPPPTNDVEDAPIIASPNENENDTSPIASASTTPISRQNQRRRQIKNVNAIELILLLIILFLSIYICIFGVISPKSNDDSNKEEEVCLRPECIITSSRILSSMDAEADPCTDFYQFSCGNWMNENVIPDDKTRISTFDSIFKKNINILRNALEGEYKATHKYNNEHHNYDQQTFQQLKNIYNTCIDTNNIDEKGKEPLVNLLTKLNIGGEGLNYKDTDEFTQLIVKLHNYATHALFDMAVSADQKNPDIHVIYIGQSGLGLPSKEYYEEEDILKVYKETIKDMFTNIFDDQNERDFDKISDLVIEFEKKLAKVTVPSQDMQDPSATYNENNITSLTEKYPYLNWKLYMEKRFSTYNIKNVIKENTLIIADAPQYFEGLNSIISEVDIETLIAYSEWHIIRVYGRYIKEDLQDPLKKLRKTLTGVKIDPPRSEYCVRVVDGIMGMAASKLFIDKAFAGDSKKAAEKSIEYIKEAMSHRIPQMSWIDRQTRNLAIKKVFALTDKIGYPDFVMNPKKS